MVICNRFRPSLLLASASIVVAACGSSNEDPAGTDTPNTTVASAADIAHSAEPAALAQCKACHSFEEGAPARVGPNLHGVFGNAAASAPGYVYSPALRSSGIIWDDAALDAYLAAPTRVVPGGRMPMGQANPVKRAEIIAYLRSLG